MIAGPERVLARRHMVVVVLRLVALLLLLVGLILLLHGLLLLIASLGGPGRGPFMSAASVVFFRHTALALSLLLPGAALVALDRRLARWVVPLPRLECPRCAYRLHDRPPRCPECGLALTSGSAD